MDQKKVTINGLEIFYQIMFLIVAVTLYSSAKDSSQNAINIHATKDYYEKFSSFAL